MGLLPGRRALTQRELDQGVQEPGSPPSPLLAASACPQLHGPQEHQPKGRYYNRKPLQPGATAPPGLKVLRHVPPGQQVGYLRQLLQAVVQRLAGSHEVRHGGSHVRQQQELGHRTVPLPVNG